MENSLTSNQDMMGSARLRYVSSVPKDIIQSLSIELSNHGFLVDDCIQELSPQASIEWALPSLTTLIMSALSGVGILTAKKFSDGFLEEIGVKALGSETAKLLKSAFSAGRKSDISYHKMGGLKCEPYLNLPKDNAESSDEENKPEPAMGVKPSPLSLEFILGGNSADNPPWKMKFIFTHDLEESFDSALGAIPYVLDSSGRRRNEAWTQFKAKLSNPKKFYGRTLPELTHDFLVHEIMNISGETSGVFLFDPTAGLWIKVWNSSGISSPSEVLKSFVDVVGPLDGPL